MSYVTRHEKNNKIICTIILIIRNTIGKNCKKNMKNAICNLKQCSEYAKKYMNNMQNEIQIPHAEYANPTCRICKVWDPNPIPLC
jgi:hypothetical protein